MKRSYHISAKQLGLILVAISISLFFVFLSSTRELMRAANIECKEICGHETEASCPHAKSIPIQSYIGYSVVFVLAGIGVFMIISGKKYHEELTEKEKKLERILGNLKEDEKRICELIKESGGAIFQSELVEKTNFSKVKVSRILDKLEGRGIIERRRRGMTNLVLIK
ncbi:MAG: hypothetical protein PWP03_253 [Candidatus Woesearchaeota archaeon]|nr:hypothetical protein [Candidatus Woesearchaeota archaeon]